MKSYSFITDPEGDRRFWTVDVKKGKLNVWQDLTNEIIDQLWAEACFHFVAGEDIMGLSDDVLKYAKEVETEHILSDPWEGIVEIVAETCVPKNWEDLGLIERRNFYANLAAFSDSSTTQNPAEFVKRNTLSAVEIWAEYMGQDPVKMTNREAIRLNACLTKMGWVRKLKRLKLYGVQRSFEKPSDPP